MLTVMVAIAALGTSVDAGVFQAGAVEIGLNGTVRAIELAQEETPCPRLVTIDELGRASFDAGAFRVEFAGDGAFRLVALCPDRVADSTDAPCPRGLPCPR